MAKVLLQLTSCSMYIFFPLLLLVKVPVLATCLQQMLSDFDQHGVQFPRWSVDCYQLRYLPAYLSSLDIFDLPIQVCFFKDRLCWGTAVVGASVYVVFLQWVEGFYCGQQRKVLQPMSIDLSIGLQESCAWYVCCSFKLFFHLFF